MNSSRMNRLEELGRVDAEKARTRKGKKNLKAEKKRIVRELKADGGRVTGRKADVGALSMACSLVAQTKRPTFNIHM